MDDLDDISDNEDLLQYVSKTSFWCDPAVGSPNSSKNASPASKQDNGAKTRIIRDFLTEREEKPQKERLVRSHMFEHSHYKHNTPNTYGVGLAIAGNNRTEPGGNATKEQGFNIPQTAAPNRIQCWTDELDDVDDGSISGPSLNGAFKTTDTQGGSYNCDSSYNYNRSNSSQHSNRNNGNASWDYSANNRGGSRGNRGSPRGNRGASPSYRGNNYSPSQGFSRSNRSPPQGFHGNNANPQGFRGNKVFYNQQQRYCSGEPLQFTRESEYGNQTFHSGRGRGYQDFIQRRPYAGTNLHLYGLYSEPLPNSFGFY